MIAFLTYSGGLWTFSLFVQTIYLRFSCGPLLVREADFGSHCYRGWRWGKGSQKLRGVIYVWTFVRISFKKSSKKKERKKNLWVNLRSVFFWENCNSINFSFAVCGYTAAAPVVTWSDVGDVFAAKQVKNFGGFLSWPLNQLSHIGIVWQKNVFFIF